MIFLNAAESGGIDVQQFRTFLKLLAPFAPHIAEELWEKNGGTTSIHLESWPQFDPTKTVADVVTIAIQINGKTRATIELAKDASQDEALAAARAHAEIAPKLAAGKEARAIYVPGKIINFVLI